MKGVKIDVEDVFEMGEAEMEPDPVSERVVPD